MQAPITGLRAVVVISRIQLKLRCLCRFSVARTVRKLVLSCVKFLYVVLSVM